MQGDLSEMLKRMGEFLGSKTTRCPSCGLQGTRKACPKCGRAACVDVLPSLKEGDSLD